MRTRKQSEEIERKLRGRRVLNRCTQGSAPADNGGRRSWKTGGGWPERVMFDAVVLICPLPLRSC